MNRPSLWSATVTVVSLFLLSGFSCLASEKIGKLGPPVALPPESVSARVPLVKVAEFHLREKRFAPAAVTDGRYIYVIGGMDEKGALLDTVERFDPATGISEEFAQLHTARLWHGAVLHQGKIYVLGGKTRIDVEPAGRGAVDMAEMRASPEARAMSRAAEAMAEALPGQPGATLRLKIDNSVEIIDLATRQVSAGDSLPTPKSNFGCVVLGDELYVLGGKGMHAGHLAYFNSVQIYSCATGRWRAGLNMPTARGDTQAVLVDGPFIVVPGGFNHLRELDVVEAFDPRTGAWIILPKLCRSVSAHSLVFMAHHLFLFGNYDAPQELVAYDLVTKMSETFLLRYTAARHTAAVVVNGRIYVIGGKVSKETVPLDLVQVFAPPPKQTAAK